MAGEFARTHTELREVTCFAGPQTVRGDLNEVHSPKVTFEYPRAGSNMVGSISIARSRVSRVCLRSLHNTRRKAAHTHDQLSFMLSSADLMYASPIWRASLWDGDSNSSYPFHQGCLTQRDSIA